MTVFATWKIKNPDYSGIARLIEWHSKWVTHQWLFSATSRAVDFTVNYHFTVPFGIMFYVSRIKPTAK